MDNELFMIELQVWTLKGSLSVMQGTIVAKESGGFDSKYLGKLRKNGQGKYELYIGNHVLEGHRETLKKPLVVINPTEKVEPFMGVDELRSSVCVVHGIVREKLIFKTRPNIAVTLLADAADDKDAQIERARLRS